MIEAVVVVLVDVVALVVVVNVVVVVVEFESSRAIKGEAVTRPARSATNEMESVNFMVKNLEESAFCSRKGRLGLTSLSSPPP